MRVAMNEKEVFIKTRELVDTGGWTSTQVSAATAQQALNALKNYWPEITPEQQAEFRKYWIRIQALVVAHLRYVEDKIIVMGILNKLTIVEQRFIKDHATGWDIDLGSILKDIQNDIKVV
jgi:hypothetical protein